MSADSPMKPYASRPRVPTMYGVKKKRIPSPTAKVESDATMLIANCLFALRSFIHHNPISVHRPQNNPITSAYRLLPYVATMFSTILQLIIP